MPKAAWCAICRDYVWLAPDGGCSQGHPRSQLRAVYEAPPVSGTIVPPPPPRPDGKSRSDGSQVELRPGPTYWRGDD